MTSTPLRTLCVMMLAAALLAAPLPARAEEPAVTTTKPARTAPANRVTLDFRDVEMVDLVQTISELTGRNFLYDETVRGKATIISPEGMTLDEAYQVFLNVLRLKGFAVVPAGKVNKIVPLKDAKEGNLPLVTDGQPYGEQFITRLVRLESLDAAMIVDTVLKPLASSGSNLMVYSPTNTLIITDTAASIERMLQLLKELDVPGSSQTLTVIPLKNAGTEDAAKLCNEMFGFGAGARRARGASATIQEEAASVKIIALPRTNSLLVQANAEQLAAVRGLIDLIDQDGSGAKSNINVYRLENASAEALAKTLNEIITGIRSEAGKTGTAGQPAAAAGPVTITADKPTNSLIINAKPDDYAIIKSIIDKLDTKRKQVYVEALIMELSMDATQKLGVSLSGAGTVGDDGLIYGTSELNNGPLSFGQIADGTTMLTQAVNGLMAGGFFNPITVANPNGEGTITVPALSVLINLSKGNSDVNILSAPRLLTSDNEEAEIIVGENVPLVSSRISNTTSDDNLNVAIERKDVALILRFTPQVTEGDLVRLNVYQESSDVKPNSDTGNGPSYTKRSLRNTVLAENGKTAVLGGLIGTNVTEGVTKVPLLGDIPLLGWLFKHRTTQERKTNLLVFINPTIIRGPEDLARVTNRNRGVADKFIGDKTRDQIPEGYFEDAKPAEAAH